MDDKITIIEGPTPAIIDSQDAWAMGICEGPAGYNLALTRLRTFNGPALVERCYHAWKGNGSMTLEYRDELGLTQTKPIVAIRSVSTEDGQVLLVWLRVETQDEPQVKPSDPDSDENYQ
jgi:hypothetical protein